MGEGYEDEEEVETGEYYDVISKLQSQHDDENEQGQEDDLLFDSDEEPSTSHRRLKNLRPSYQLSDRRDDEDNDDDLDSYGSLIDNEMNNDELEVENEDDYYNRSDDDGDEDDDVDEGEDDDYEKYLSSKKRRMKMIESASQFRLPRRLRARPGRGSAPLESQIEFPAWKNDPQNPIEN